MANNFGHSYLQVPTIAPLTKIQSSDAHSKKQYPCMSNNSSIEVPNICTISSNSETFSASSSQPDYSCEDHDEDDDGDDDDLINVGTFTIMQPRQDAVNPFLGIKAL